MGSPCSTFARKALSMVVLYTVPPQVPEEGKELGGPTLAWTVRSLHEVCAILASEKRKKKGRERKGRRLFYLYIMRSFPRFSILPSVPG